LAKSQERKKAKLKMESARSERLRQRRKEDYNVQNKEVKKSAREDNRTWLEN